MGSGGSVGDANAGRVAVGITAVGVAAVGGEVDVGGGGLTVSRVLGGVAEGGAKATPRTNGERLEWRKA